jgi:hypothetical protein
MAYAPVEREFEPKHFPAVASDRLEMHMMRWKFAALISVLTAACTPAPPPLLPADHNGPPELPAALPPTTATDQISAERMSEVTRVLASDDFQGRSMGGPGEEKTITYLIQQFHMAGLEPGGENGSWTQSVPMIRTKLQSPSVSIIQAGVTRPLKVPDDVYLSTVRDTTRASIASHSGEPSDGVASGSHSLGRRGGSSFDQRGIGLVS